MSAASTPFDPFDFSHWKAREARRVELAAQILPRNKAIVFDALEAAKIALVNVIFDGGGDSGQIESVSATSADNIAMELPDVEIDIELTEWVGDGVRFMHTSLSDAIEELCYAFLSEEHAGWENNEGAFGEFAFSVADRTVALDHNVRISDTAYYAHEW